METRVDGNSFASWLPRKKAAHAPTDRKMYSKFRRGRCHDYDLWLEHLMRLAIEKACPAQVAHFIAIATGNTRQYILYIDMATRLWEGHILILTVDDQKRLVNLMTCKVVALRGGDRIHVMSRGAGSENETTRSVCECVDFNPHKYIMIQISVQNTAD